MPMYFTGKKVSGYLIIKDPSIPGSGSITLETRQCAHCGFHGLYNPGNAKIYAQYITSKNLINGICIPCGGLTCMKRSCNIKCEVLEKRIELFEAGKRLTL